MAERSAFCCGVMARLRSFLRRVGGTGVPGGGAGFGGNWVRASWSLRETRSEVSRLRSVARLAASLLLAERRSASSE